jgi:hypothetical protein
MMMTVVMMTDCGDGESVMMMAVVMMTDCGDDDDSGYDD